MSGKTIDLDAFAQRLAARQGQSWRHMSDYPGYARNMWRETAREELLALMPDAVIESLPVRWDGRDAGWRVRMR